VILGLSGGIDSALVLAVAVDALGEQAVSAVMMPSRYTADISQTDAHQMAEQLKVRYQVIPIGEVTDALEKSLSSAFEGCSADLTEENLQSRTRGTLLMALSTSSVRWC